MSVTLTDGPAIAQSLEVTIPDGGTTFTVKVIYKVLIGDQFLFFPVQTTHPVGVDLIDEDLHRKTILNPVLALYGYELP